MRAALIVLSGCGGGPWDETFEEGLRHLSGTFDTDGAGRGAISFDVLDGETAFAAVVQASPLRSNLPQLDGPGGVLLVADTQTDHLVTNAGFVSPVSVFAWPILDGDPELSSGAHQVDVGTLAAEELAYESGSFQADVWFGSDADLATGAVKARVVWADGLGDAATKSAFDDAFSTWQVIYEARGLSVTRLDDVDWSGGPLGLPGETLDTWTEMSAAGPARVVNLVVVESIDGLPQAFGLAGGIPGPIGSSGSSGVIISHGLAAGVDGSFSSLESRILGETLAHECGHYLGLYHPVEIGWDRWDALDDTPDCDAEGLCEDAFSDNLMFPYPVCTLRDCTAQDVLTDQQGRGMHRNPLVD